MELISLNWMGKFDGLTAASVGEFDLVLFWENCPTGNLIGVLFVKNQN